MLCEKAAGDQQMGERAWLISAAAGWLSPLAGGNRYSILKKLLPAALADQMPHMGGLIGEGLAEYRVGQEAGAKGLPEGFARLLGHDVLAVVAGDQHYQVVGFDAAFSANM